MTAHKNIFEALVAAQAIMGKVVKKSENPHFRSSYADLADVMSVALPALNAQGICLWHRMDTSGETALMVTTLTHGASQTSIECGVPLIVSKQDMQGMKSATTYAKRIGVESLTGIAPEDDDGNAAAKAPPPPKPKAKIADERRETLRKVFESVAKMEDLAALWENMSAEERVVFEDLKNVTKERLK